MKPIELHNPEYLNPSIRYQVIDNPIVLRDWQRDAFELLKDEPFSIVNASGGSGKSKLSVMLSVYSVVKKGFKNLIVVPQQHQHKGFIRNGELNTLTVEMDGIEYKWHPKNYCDPTETEKTIKSLKEWLLTPFDTLRNNDPTIISGVVACCTSVALCLAWNRMNDEERLTAIFHTHLRNDEGHHLKNIFDEDDVETDKQEQFLIRDGNELGKIGTFIVQNGKETSGMTLTTATPFRNIGNILFPKASDLFEIYSLDFLKHWDALGIEKFCMQFQEYKEKDPIKCIIDNIKKEPKEKHLVIIPSTGNRWRTDKKVLHRLLNALYKIYPKERVLDLVTPETQARNKELLLKEPEVKGDSKFDVVVMCMLGREGTDWCPLTRIHHAAIENSKVLAVQTLFRLFRMYEGKINIGITYYIKQFRAISKCKKREDLSDRTNATLYCILVEDMTNSFVMPTIPDQNGDDRVIQRTTLLNYLGQEKFTEIMERGIDEYHLLDKHTPHDVDNMVQKICEEFQIDDNTIKDKITDAILRRVIPQEEMIKFQLVGIDIKWIREKGFDKVIPLEPSMFEAKITTKDIQHLQQLVRNSWDIRFQELLNYKQTHGHCYLPYNSKLGQWCNAQRGKYRQKQLTAEQIKQLESIGFVWELYDEKWNNKFQELVQFKATNRNIPYNSELGYWLNNQRTAYKHKTLPADKIKQLESIGIDWKPTDSNWNRMYQELITFMQHNKQQPSKMSQLGQWCNAQRYKYKRNKLTVDKIQMLEAIAFKWAFREEQWEEYFKQLCTFKQLNGHCNVPYSYNELGKWCARQRRNYTRHILDADKIKQLKNIGFDWQWDSLESNWNEMYLQLCQFKTLNGHSDVPQKHPILGKWICSQRKSFKKKTLSLERQHKLEKLAIRWNPMNDNWNTMYQELTRFKKENGNCDVTHKCPLRKWCRTQKDNYRKHTLSSERIRQLEKIGFDWQLKVETVEESISVAKELVKQGIKMNGHNLRKLGYSRIAAKIERHPEQFKFLKGKCNIAKINNLK